MRIFYIEVAESGGRYLWEEAGYNKVKLVATQDLVTGIWSKAKGSKYFEGAVLSNLKDWSFKLEQLSEKEVFIELL
jgi:hypothetical protein